MSNNLKNVSTLPEASTSTLPAQTLCNVCNLRTSIYTCPGCSIRTCSLPCSTGHKTTTGCTGQRNKVAYVPMNKYGWGTMMDDYVFLEDMGRKVGDWGREIVKGGYGIQGATSLGRGRGRGRGRGNGRPRGHTKRDQLKVQLEARNIDMDLLPAGMERRKLNQSYWEPKSHSAFLTIEFKLHPPRDPLAPSSQSAGPPLVLLTHKNKMDSSLLKLAQQAADRVLSKKDGATNGWLRRFLFPDPDNPSSFTPPHFIMAAKMKPRSAAFQKSHHRAAYYRFDPSESFATLLRNTSFVEFPTIEVWEEFTGTVVNVQGTVTELPADDEPNAKRRKLSRKAGKEAINGLLGDYGSEEDEEVALAPANGLALLDGYAESDAGEGDIAGDGDDDAIRDDALQGSDDEVEVELDAEALLELMRHAHGEERWAEKIRLGEEVDWGASGDEEP